MSEIGSKTNMTGSVEHADQVSGNSVNSKPRHEKTTKDGIVLVPQPSDDPADPLNWPTWKRNMTLAIISLASMAGTLQALANSSGLFQQARAYHKTVIQITYSLAAANAGLAVGPLIWTPVALRFGRCAAIFWGMLLTLLFNVWGALCTGEGDYVSFVWSRLCASLAGSCATTIGAGAIVETFFLHERGRAFAIYLIAILIGSTAGPTLSGFIVQGAPWPVQYWYNIALEGLIVVLTFFFLQETGYSRDGSAQYPVMPNGFLANRAATFITGKVVPKKTWGEMWHRTIAPFLVGISPVGLMGGLVLFVNFGWGVGVNTLLAVYLQSPVKEGGYGFTAEQNAYFSFAAWVGVAFAQAYSYLFNDRIPLSICRRFGHGVWRPEYRLHTLWVTALFLLPVGLGLFGASLQYHLHYMVLALGLFCIFFGGSAAVPVIVNYVVECYAGYGNEAAAVLNLYRISLGVIIPFFVTPWTERVGLGWVFGMMGCFSVAIFGLIVALIWRGHEIRGVKGIGLMVRSEDGARVVKDGANSAMPEKAMMHH